MTIPQDINCPDAEGIHGRLSGLYFYQLSGQTFSEVRGSSGVASPKIAFPPQLFDACVLDDILQTGELLRSASIPDQVPGSFPDNKGKLCSTYSVV